MTTETISLDTGRITTVANIIDALDDLLPYFVHNDPVYEQAYNLSCALVAWLVHELGTHGLLDGAEVCDEVGEPQGVIARVGELGYSGERFIEGVPYELAQLARECGALGGAFVRLPGSILLYDAAITELARARLAGATV